MGMNIGLTILRVVLGLLFVGHGTQKLFGWFGGHGLTGTGNWFESVGYRPGRRSAALAGVSEATGGLLTAAGLLTPLAAAILVGVMLAASAVHAPKGLWTSDGGFELPGFYAVTALALAFTGPGRYSVDHWLGLSWGWQYGVYALAAAVVAATPLILQRTWRQRRHRTGVPTPPAGQRPSVAV